MGHVRRGNIAKVDRGGSMFLKKEDVMALKARMETAQ
jgi:hypothetical protein